jgi:hypothetical protein
MSLSTPESVRPIKTVLSSFVISAITFALAAGAYKASMSIADTPAPETHVLG